MYKTINSMGRGFFEVEGNVFQDMFPSSLFNSAMS